MITAVSSKSDNSAEDKQRVDKLNNAVAVKVGSLKLFGGQLRKVAAITHNEQSICGGHNAVAVNITRKDSACGFTNCCCPAAHTASRRAGSSVMSILHTG